MFKTQPLISIIIPTYNRADAVCQAVRSALRQTYSSREIVVVDDGSTDDTLERLKVFGTQVRVISSRNRGAAAARNRGIDAAQGDLIAFLDSDDLWLPEKLDRQVEALNAMGDRYGACFTDSRHVGNPNMILSAFEEAKLSSSEAFATLNEPFSWILGRHTPMYVVTLLVRRSLANDLKGFDESLPVGEDTDFLFRLAFRTQFCFVSQKLVEVDRSPSRGEGLMELFYEQSDRMYTARRSMFSKWLGLPQLTEPLRKEIQGHLRELLYDWAVRKIYQRSYPEALRHVREIRDVGESYSAILTRLVHRGLRRIRYKSGRAVSSNNGAELIPTK